MKIKRENRSSKPQFVLPFLLCLLAILNFSYFAFSSENTPDTVLIVSTFPKSKGFLRAFLQKARENKETESLRFQTLQTWADEEETQKALEKIGQNRIRSCIFLDSRSAFLLSNKINCQSIYLARSKGMLEESGETPLWKSPNATVVETGPSAESFLQALEMISPPPKRIGIVYTEKSPGNDDFVRELKSRCEKDYKGKLLLSAHPLSAAACKNSAAIKTFTEKNFNSFEKGNLLLVLPGQNTIKFSYVFRNYAKERHLGLAALGEIPAGGAILHVGFSDEELAAHCFQLLLKPEGKFPHKTKSARNSPRPGVRFDSKIMKPLGYTLKTGANLEKPETKYYYLKPPHPSK